MFAESTYLNSPNLFHCPDSQLVKKADGATDSWYLYGTPNENAYTRATQVSTANGVTAIIVNTIKDAGRSPLSCDTGRSSGNLANNSVTSWLWHVESGNYGVLKACHGSEKVNMGFVDGHVSPTHPSELNDIAFNGYEAGYYKKITWAIGSTAKVHTVTVP